MPNSRAGLAVVLLMLAGCTPDPRPLDQDLIMVGMEPFWAATVSNKTKTMKFSHIGDRDLEAGYPVETKTKDAVVLTSKAPDGDIVMTLHKKTCMDGMSNRKYPWTASVTFKGQTMRGCGGPKEAPEG